MINRRDMSKSKKAILIPKTHWDREHSRSFEQLRWHLVHNVVDSLLAIMARDPDYRVFMFDGQSQVIDDYLEMRPEREADIRRLVAGGRLAIGPFFVGPDEHIPSGESLIRSLLLGHQVAERYGGVMKVGYNPDAFGHVAQLPQILRGFEIDAAAFMRGASPEIGPFGTDFVWEAPDGSEVVATHFLYVNAWHLPEAIEEAADRLGRSITAMEPKELPYYVLMHGSDGCVPDPRMPRIVASANERLADVQVEQGTLVDYFDLVRPEAARLPRHRGELRHGAYQLILGGVYSSRPYVKQENARTQTLLERHAEPLAVMAWCLLGDRYPQPFLAKAWRKLAENHFHDTICGCSQDVVYRDAMQRYAHSSQIGEQVRHRALKVLTGAMDTTPPEMAEDSGQHGRLRPLVVYNPHPAARAQVVSARIARPVMQEGRAPRYVVFDADGRQVAAQVRDHKVQEEFIFTDQLTAFGHAYPPGRRVRTFDLTFLADELPAYGLRTYYYSEIRATGALHNHPLLTGPQVPATDLRIAGRTMENDALRVTVAADGTVAVTDKGTGHTYRGLHYFEDEESACGEYHHYRTANSQVISTQGAAARISLVEEGPVCATFKVDIDLLLPAGLSDDLQSRSERLVPCPITTLVTLPARGRRVEFATRIENAAKDHRLRVRFETGLRAQSVNAESAFHVIERDIALPEAIGWIEPPVPESPQQSFVSVTDGTHGLTVLNRGIVEYAAEQGAGGVTLSLTLLRSTGWIGREFFNTGPYKIATPDAQCIGTNEFAYALIPHAGDWQQARVWLDAHRFASPCTVTDPLRYPTMFPWQIEDLDDRDYEPGYRAGAVSLSGNASLLSLEPDDLIVCAVKKAEEDDALIVRLYNISTRPQEATLAVPAAVTQAWRANMLEQPHDPLPVARVERCGREMTEVRFPVKPHEIVTLKLAVQAAAGVTAT